MEAEGFLISLLLHDSVRVVKNSLLPPLLALFDCIIYRCWVLRVTWGFKKHIEGTIVSLPWKIDRI